MLLLLLVCASAAHAQRSTGELRIVVVDPSGAALPARGTLAGQATQVRRQFETDPDGRYIAKDLPFGSYRLEVQGRGFAPSAAIVEIESALPVERRVMLSLAEMDTAVTVTDSATLVDPHRTGAVQYLGGETLKDRPATAPGRSVLELVNSQPGWLLEANGILHPRGAEYDTQYVVDGIPLTENRSPAFAPEIDADEVQSLSVLTGNYPAEYGRKLGGVVEVSTRRDDRPGLHARASIGGGSFDTLDGAAGLQYARGGSAVALNGAAARTGRYLDPPVLQNFNNSAGSGSLGGRFERDVAESDRLRVSAARRETRFLVPNELLQQQAGQRQDRTSGETSGQFSWQHVFSPQVLGNARAMVRDVDAKLWSNPFSTPISAAQDRGFREVYVNASVGVHAGEHEFKTGVEASFANLHETFGYDIAAYQIGTAQIFDPGTPPNFRYSGSGHDREQSAFVQDLVHIGRMTLSAGLRWDHYKLLVDEQAFSPRLGAAWFFPRLSLVLRASYDRVFQTPAMENLLLSSSPAALALNNAGVFLPVHPSRGNFYEVGLSKGIGGKLRLDAQVFRRDLDHFGDDDLLLNTGVSFPIAFSHARIEGGEVKLELPRWGPLSGFASYSNLSGKARLPLTGGLFLDDSAASLLQSTAQLPITQDQRNTAGARIRTELGPRAWAAVAASYGSGLPIEAPSLDLSLLTQQYGPAILNRLNLDRERVRPSFSLDASTGIRIAATDHWTARLQADGSNLTDRLNVINFAGLFSGTAIARPRCVLLRLTVEF